MVMGDNSCAKGREFESRRRILDGHFLYCLFEKAENKPKRGRGLPIKKSSLKHNACIFR